MISEEGTVLGSRKSRLTARWLAEKLGWEYNERNIESNGPVIRYGNSYTEDPEDNYILNLRESVRQSSNKPLAKKMLFEASVPTPRPVTFEDALSGNVAFPLIVRRNHHFKGRFFYIVNSVRDLQKYDPANHYIQELVTKIDEYRLFILNDKIIEANIKRCPENAPMIRNHEHGCYFARSRVSELPRSLKDAARKSVSIVGLDFAAVDCGTIQKGDHQDVTIFEINSAPGLIERKLDLLVAKLDDMDLIS